MEIGDNFSGESGNQWLAPVYDMSKRVEIDPEILKTNRCVCINSNAQEIEYYKILRTQIVQKMQQHNWKTLMITSVQQGEGKTITAINMALTFARAFNQTVLLVDSDLKQQSVHQYMNYESEIGLIDYLLDDRPVQELIVWPGIDKLTIMSGGRMIQDSTELLNSQKMKVLVEQMKERYQDRYILFDVPPIIGRADALAFAAVVDCILIVVQAYRTPKNKIKEALDLMPGEKLLGFVLNRQRQY
ncbi:MAG: CpsD/CapB family tyrosine-protein kinase [Proteobacteria bacterium]|nr:CpsD/CapB family tyrosine-protein kinase [Pseudomonadota bacterium]